MSYDDAYERVIARNYDAVYSVIREPSGDAAFYRALARQTGGPVLELGCGTGRVLIPIADDGIECVGVDSSPEMLAVLRAKRPPANLSLVEGRMERFDLGDRRFRLITAPFRAFSHLLDVDAQLAGLACIRRHLVPGGLFAFDLFDPKLARTALVEEPEQLAVTFHDGAYEIRRWDTVRRDLSRQVLTVTFRFEGGPPELAGSADVQLRWFYRYEIEHLLARAGFSDITVWGDYRKGPWKAEGETVVLARVPQS
jgi:ubiquinone/menaquinone biosynthesis C-methylase UbiE